MVLLLISTHHPDGTLTQTCLSLIALITLS